MIEREGQVRVLGTHSVTISDSMAALRDYDTAPDTFRALVDKLAPRLMDAVVDEFGSAERQVETPLESCVERVRVSRRVVLAPVMRSGLGLLYPGYTRFPNAGTWFLGMRRVEKAGAAIVADWYYDGTPNDFHEREGHPTVLVLDPMLATGASAVAACSRMRQQGFHGEIIYVNLLCAPEGVHRLLEAHPDVTLFTVSIDRCLNEKGYILPGLGDAGDRQFPLYPW